LSKKASFSGGSLTSVIVFKLVTLSLALNLALNLAMPFALAADGDPEQSAQSQELIAASASDDKVATGTRVLRASVSNVEEINRQIILKEIELERYSVSFRKYNNVQGRWRGWRYFLSQEANSALTASGLTVQLIDRERVINRANVFKLNDKGELKYVQNSTNRVTQERGLVLQMIGQYIGATGSAIELGINYYHGYKARKAGYGPAHGIAHVLKLKGEIEALFVERAKLIESGNLDGDDLAIARAEELVLRDITDMGLQEYATFHASARRFRAFQDSLYRLDIAKNITGATGNLVNVVATHNRTPRLSGPAGVLTTTSGALIMLTPLMARGVGKIVELRHKRALKPILAGTSPHSVDQLDEHRAALAALESKFRGTDVSQNTPANSNKSLTLLAAYDKESAQRRKQLALATREIRAGTRSATQNIGTGFAVGGSKIALGVTNMIAGWKYSKFAHKSNSVVAAGTISYMSGSYLAVVDNLRLRVVDELNRKRLGKRGDLPMQVLGDKLKSLDQLEASLKICADK
jgi:hypothetical protein